MASLTGTKIKDTYDSLLKVSDNGALDGTLQTITDGVGNNSALSLSTAGASVGGTLAVSGATTLSSTLAVTGVSTLNSNVVIQPSNDADDTLRIYRGKDSGFEATSGVIDVKGGNLNIKSISNDSVRYISLKHSSNSGSSYSESARFYTTGDISFRDSSANEAFYWDASAASLGIGGVPSQKLEVVGNVLVKNSLGNAIAFTAAEADNSGTFYMYNNGSLTNVISTNGNSYFNGGNVGIGTDTNLNLGVSGLRGLSIYGSSYSGLQLRNSTGNFEIGVGFLTSTDVLIRNNMSGNLRFGIDSTERMRITSGGFLKASNSGTYFNSTGSYHEVRNSVDAEVINYDTHTGTNPYGKIIRFSNSIPNNTTNWFLSCSDQATERLYIYSNGNVVNSNNSYGAISDAKLKENVVDASPKLEDLMQVQVRNFNYIGDDKKQLGVVAQELEQVFPSMIDESPDYEEVEVPQLDENGQEVLDENGEVVMTKERVDLGTVTKSVKYSVFVPMLIKAIQELNAKVESLEAQLNA